MRTATATSPAFAHGPSTILLGDLEVVRLGFGAMRLPGPDAWGEPEDPARARDVLRRVVSLGMNLIDSAWFYGPHVANRLIAETLHPYPKGLVWDAIRVRDQLRHEGQERVEGTTRSLPLWSEYAASLFEAKVAEGRLT